MKSISKKVRNKLRYGFEGTTVGGGFPLLGKGLQLGYKYLGPKFVLKQGLRYGSRGVNNAVFRFPSYLLSKVPTNALVRGTQKLSAYATKKAINPLIKKTFGKDPFKQLPDFEDWRLLSVTSPKLGERNLKRFDNFLSWFRTYGKDPTDVGRARETGQLFVKSRARRFDKTLSGLEKKAYDLAQAFQRRYNTNDTSKASESFYLDKVDDFIKNKIKITEIPKELRGFALDLRKQLDKTLKEFKDYLPKDSEVPRDLKNFLTKNLKNYYVRSFSIFSKPFYVPPQDIRKNAVDWITKNIVTKNRDLREVSVNAYNKNKVNPQQAYRLYAEDMVDDILTVGRTDGSNPIERLKQIGTKILRDDNTQIVETVADNMGNFEYSIDICNDNYPDESEEITIIAGDVEIGNFIFPSDDNLNAREIIVDAPSSFIIKGRTICIKNSFLFLLFSIIFNSLGNNVNATGLTSLFCLTSLRL